MGFHAYEPSLLSSSLTVTKSGLFAKSKSLILYLKFSFKYFISSIDKPKLITITSVSFSNLFKEFNKFTRLLKCVESDPDRIKNSSLFIDGLKRYIRIKKISYDIIAISLRLFLNISILD